MNSISKVTNIGFTEILLITVPVTNLYSFFGSQSVSIFDFLLVFTAFCLIARFLFFYKQLHINRSISYILFVLLLALIVPFLIGNTLSLSSSFASDFLRFSRLIFYFIMGIVLSNSFNYIRYKKYIMIFALIVCIFLCLQYLFLIAFKLTIPGFIYGLPLMRANLVSHIESADSSLLHFRFRSILGEPSQIGFVIGLAIFSNKDLVLHPFKTKFLSSIISISAILSASATSLFVLTLWACFYLYSKLFSAGKFRIPATLFALSVLLLFLVANSFIDTSTNNLFVDRSVRTIIPALIGRIGYSWSIFSQIPLFHGTLYNLDQADLWMPSFSKFFYFYGIFIGAFLFALYSLLCFLIAINNMYLGSFWFLSGFVTEHFVGHFSILFIATCLTIKYSYKPNQFISCHES